jgi:hypothetical protein
MKTTRGFRTVLRRYQSVALLGTLLGCSSVFVACGSDDDTETGTGGKGASGGKAGTGGFAGKGGTGGSGGSTGGAGGVGGSTGGAGGVGGSTGGTGGSTGGTGGGAGQAGGDANDDVISNDGAAGAANDNA